MQVQSPHFGETEVQIDLILCLIKNEYYNSYKNVWTTAKVHAKSLRV